MHNSVATLCSLPPGGIAREYCTSASRQKEGSTQTLQERMWTQGRTEHACPLNGMSLVMPSQTAPSLGAGEPRIAGRMRSAAMPLPSSTLHVLLRLDESR